ncbi:MAG: P1 family peptidase [Caldilineaceae bacterium]
MAFATGNELPAKEAGLRPLQMVPHNQMDRFFEAVVEATEESIWNALTAAESTTGFQGRTVHAIPLDALQAAVGQGATEQA